MEPIILASGSPQRQDFFRLMGLPFISIPAMIDETPPRGLPLRQAVEEVARRKAAAVAARRETDARWVLGADTIITLSDELFGKPADRDAARAMLERLAGRRHEVITAVALYCGQRKTIDCRSVSTAVSFAPLQKPEIEWYLDTGEWEGAAGSYRLQGRGSCLIDSITGSPSAVVGLPLRELYVMLKDNGYPYGASAPHLPSFL